MGNRRDWWPKYSWDPNEDKDFADHLIDYVPFSLSMCPLCHSLVPDGHENDHKQWHLEVGH